MTEFVLILLKYRGLQFLFILAVICFVLKLLTKRKTRHQRKIQTADFILNRIKDFSEGQKIAYLRKVDPYSFEELILTCLERKGFPIQRNKRYSGDGGIDGRFFIEGKLNLVQAKRYSGEIRYEHVGEFAELLKEYGCNGIFVHTGKTPRNISLRNIDMSAITIISGSRLIDLLNTERKKVI